MSKIVKLIITCSFLLNVILLGVFIGGIINKKEFHVPVLENVSTQTRQVMKQSMKKNRSQMREQFEQMREHKDDLREIILADKFDMVKYNQLMEKILQGRHDIEKQKSETLGNALSSLSQQQRSEMSSHILQKISGKRRPPQKIRKHMKDKENIR